MRSQEMKNISAGINPLGPSKKVKAAVRRAVGRINRTADDESRLIRQFASRLGTAQESVVLSSAFPELAARLMDALRPERVCVLGPSDGWYERAGRVAASASIALTASAHSGFAVGAELLEDAALRPGDLVVTTDPNRVTGRAIGRTELLGIAEKVRSAGAVLLVDQSLAGFTGLATVPPELVADGSVVVIGTTVFYYGLPGLELAFALAAPACAGAMRAACACAPNLLAVVAAREAWKDASFVRLTGGYMAEEQALLKKRLANNAGWEVLTSDSGVFLAAPPSGAQEAAARLGAAGFAVRQWSGGQDDSRTFFRFSVMKHEDNLRVAKILAAPKRQTAAGGGDARR
ncbi:MAG: threonine-phosphate decarboxylase CobD [Thermodesulfovibrionales bacterium]